MLDRRRRRSDEAWRRMPRRMVRLGGTRRGIWVRLWISGLLLLCAMPAGYGSLAPFAVTAQVLPPISSPTPASDGPSPFLADDDPPPLVQAVGAWSGGAGGTSGRTCWFGADDHLITHRSGGTVQPCMVGINNHLRVVADADEWEPDSARVTDLRIVRSDGAALEQAPDEDGDPIWWLSPGSPTGRYLVTARKDDREVQGDFAVVLRETFSDEPWPRARIWPRVGPPGTRFRVVLAGFEPGQMVSLYLNQGLTIRNGLFLTTLETVRANERGEATTSVTSRANDPEGVYSIVTEPLSRGMALGAASFGLSATRDIDELERLEYELWKSDRDRHVRRARAIVVDANRVWASVVAKNGRGVEYLRCYFDGPWLAQSISTVQAMRANGEFRAARMISPPMVVDLSRKPGDTDVLSPFEVTVLETWDDQLFDASGQVLQVAPSRSKWHYKIRSGSRAGTIPGAEQGTGESPRDCPSTSWFIWEAERLPM